MSEGVYAQDKLNIEVNAPSALLPQSYLVMCKKWGYIFRTYGSMERSRFVGLTIVHLQHFLQRYQTQQCTHIHST